MKIIGEILGLLFVIALCWYLRSDANISLLNIGKIVLLTYIPQKIALYLECRYLLKQNRKVEK